MRPRSLLAALITCVLALASAAQAQTAPPIIVDPCHPGAAYMGCSQQPHVITGLPPRVVTAAQAPPAGPLFPDVYEGQGQPNWFTVAAWQRSHGWPAQAIFKLGEFRLDSQAVNNATRLRAAGMHYAAYWFVRNTGCGGEASQIVADAKFVGVTHIFLDLEVPEAAGYGACLSPPLRRAGLWVGEYTSPGTDPGGVDTTDALWIATYGPHFSCLWTCHPVAWQFTDGRFFAPVFVPGVGQDDVNLDMGIGRILAPPPPPDPFLILSHNKWHLANGQVASEYNTARTWAGAHCLNPVRRQVCKSTRYHLQLLADRLTNLLRGRKDVFNRKARLAILERLLHQK